MTLSTIDKSLLLATYYRGGHPDDESWTSNTDQILTLSLYYTGEFTGDECAARFVNKGYVGCLYDGDGELIDEIERRYLILIELLKTHPDLIEGGGNFELPADPTYTACRLAPAGFEIVPIVIDLFPEKPDFPNWPDKRRFPEECPPWENSSEPPTN